MICIHDVNSWKKRSPRLVATFKNCRLQAHWDKNYFMLKIAFYLKSFKKEYKHLFPPPPTRHDLSPTSETGALKNNLKWPTLEAFRVCLGFQRMTFSTTTCLLFFSSGESLLWRNQLGRQFTWSVAPGMVFSLLPRTTAPKHSHLLSLTHSLTYSLTFSSDSPLKKTATWLQMPSFYGCHTLKSDINSSLIEHGNLERKYRYSHSSAGVSK